MIDTQLVTGKGSVAVVSVPIEAFRSPESLPCDGCSASRAIWGPRVAVNRRNATTNLKNDSEMSFVPVVIGRSYESKFRVVLNHLGLAFANATSMQSHRLNVW